MLKKLTPIVVFIYGLLLLAFGVYGYCHSGSKASLIAGSGFGVLLMIVAAYLYAGKTWANAAAFALTFIMTVMFAVRYAISLKANPATLAILSCGVLLFLFAQMAKNRKGGYS